MKQNAHLCLLVLFGTLCIAGCAAPASYDQNVHWADIPKAASMGSSANHQLVSGPIDPNHILVPVEINGQQFHMILDTGSEALVIWNRTAHSLGMPTSPSAENFRG